MDLKRWKILKSTLVTVAFVVFGAFAIQAGADPTPIATLTLLVTALYNGVEWGELSQIGQGIGIEITPIEEGDE